MQYDKTIQGLTVNLRPLVVEDAEVTYAMRTNPEKARYIHRSSGTVNDQRDFIRRQMNEPGDWLFVVEDKGGNPIGMKGIYGLSKDRKRVETGRFMNFGTQVQGAEALCLGFDFAFDVLGVDEVIMSALEDNANMLSMQRRFGACETHREFNADFDCDSIWSVLTREAYVEARPKVMALVERFAGR